MDFDLILMVDSPPALSNESASNDKKDLEKSKKLNHICMMIIKKAIPKIFKSLISKRITSTKGFLVDIEKRFVKYKKDEIGMLLTSLI